jgi:hypothetical protein
MRRRSVLFPAVSIFFIHAVRLEGKVFAEYPIHAAFRNEASFIQTAPTFYLFDNLILKIDGTEFFSTLYSWTRIIFGEHSQ